MASSTSQFCVICKIDKTGVKVQRLRDGFDNMKRMSLRKGEISLHDELVNMRESNTPMYVHENCRKLLTDKRPRNDSAGGSNSGWSKVTAVAGHFIFIKILAGHLQNFTSIF